MFMMKKRNLTIFLIIAVLLGAGLSTAGFYVISTDGGNYVKVSTKDYQQLTYMSQKYSKLEQLEEAIDTYYYKEVPDDDLELGIYKGLFWGLGDIYSNYLTAEEYENMTIFTTGEFEGIGVTISATESGSITVVSTIEGSPAQKAGLKTGDMILKVDDVDYSSSDLDIAAAAIRGKPGTSVKITYMRGEKTTEINVTRANIVNQSVKSKILDGNIGYIQILQFESNTDEDFQKELRDMEMKTVSGIIIDLRNNGGGIVDSGVEIADMLLPEGIITILEDRNGEGETYKSDGNCTKIPYVLLVNKGTASTSEIVASAIKDNKGGKIVGTTTFGKGVVQSITPLPDGDAIKLTIMQYLSPNRNVIDKVGVEPNYVVELIEGDETDYQLNKALELLK